MLEQLASTGKSRGGLFVAVADTGASDTRIMTSGLYIENYDCPKINYVNLFNKINLFKNTIVFDSTNYMSNKADKYLLNNKFIFEENDTHLNEIGLDVLSDFVLYSLNELN